MIGLFQPSPRTRSGKLAHVAPGSFGGTRDLRAGPCPVLLGGGLWQPESPGPSAVPQPLLWPVGSRTGSWAASTAWLGGPQ